MKNMLDLRNPFSPNKRKRINEEIFSVWLSFLNEILNSSVPENSCWSHFIMSGSSPKPKSSASTIIPTVHTFGRYLSCHFAANLIRYPVATFGYDGLQNSRLLSKLTSQPGHHRNGGMNLNRTQTSFAATIFYFPTIWNSNSNATTSGALKNIPTIQSISADEDWFVLLCCFMQS